MKFAIHQFPLLLPKNLKRRIILKLFYRKYGEGQPIIILHGLFGISDNWVTIGKRLAENYEVYLLDQRNHGQSPHSDTFNYYALVDDLFEFIADHQLVNPIIIGHSMGGKVAMKFALEYPAKVEKLIIVDMSIREYPARPTHIDIIDTMLSVDFSKITSRKEVDDFVSEKIKLVRIRQFVLKNLYHINNIRFGWRINIQAVSDNLENVFEAVTSPYPFEKPALFIKAGLSDYIPDEDKEPIKKIFPMAEFETIDGASHWVHAEKPDELIQAILSFA